MIEYYAKIYLMIVFILSFMKVLLLRIIINNGGNETVKKGKEREREREREKEGGKGQGERERGRDRGKIGGVGVFYI